jgi:hypothetical protein
LPPSAIDPPSGLSRPVMHRQSSSLPDPTSPTRLTISPFLTEKLIELFSAAMVLLYLMNPSFLRSIVSATAASRTIPFTASCAYGLVFSKINPSLSAVTINAPSAAFLAPPIPPVNATPPTATAVTAVDPSLCRENLIPSNSI